MSIILDKVRSVRKGKGYSQEELAEKIGVEQKTYSNWERGRTEMTIVNLEKIATALDVDVKVFWDPAQFEDPNWKPHPDISFTIGKSSIVYQDKKMAALEDCNKIIDEMKNEIDRLKSVNLALSRSLNSLFDQQAQTS